LQIYLAVTPDVEQQAASCGCALSHVAYRIGPDSTLLRQNLLLQTKGGLLSVSDRNTPPIPDVNTLCAAVLRECARRSYEGVVLDFEEPPRQDRLKFAELLGQLLPKRQRTLYVPESYARAAPTAMVLVGTAVSGGTFRQHLKEAAAQYGSRLALDVERVRMDFRLPARTGIGTPLTGEDLAELMKQHGSPSFFSPDLCARYFTYQQQGTTHFVLFDDANTLRRKIRLGTELGASAAFFMWPEIRDLADGLFPL